MNKRKFYSTTDILSKTGILLKITENVVRIASSLWTRYLILKNLHANVCVT